MFRIFVRNLVTYSSRYYKRTQTLLIHFTNFFFPSKSSVHHIHLCLIPVCFISQMLFSHSNTLLTSSSSFIYSYFHAPTYTFDIFDCTPKIPPCQIVLEVMGGGGITVWLAYTVSFPKILSLYMNAFAYLNCFLFLLHVIGQK